MQSEKQYIDLYNEAQQMIKDHAASVLNEVRDKAFEDFRRLGFPDRKVERYKYTDMQKLFEPDYGLNLNRLEIPVNPTRLSSAMFPTSALPFISLSTTSSIPRRCRRQSSMTVSSSTV